VVFTSVKLVQQHWREHEACGDKEYQAWVQRVQQPLVWLCFRFSLSYGDVEEMMAERGVTVSYETIREWCRIYREPNQSNALRTYLHHGVIIIDGVRRLQLQEDFPLETEQCALWCIDPVSAAALERESSTYLINQAKGGQNGDDRTCGAHTG
jgi:hypothetical protein